jgi:hypothetical protein
MYCPGKQAWLAVCKDGENWNEEDFIMIDDYDGVMVLGEPNIVDLGGGHVVVVMRNDDEDWKATFSQSADDGKTWTPFVAPTPYYDLGIADPPLGAASVQIELIGDRVYFFTTAREPVGRYVEYVCSRDEFIADPASLWDPARTPNVSRLTTVQPSGAHYLNAGYGSILPIEGHEYTAFMCYYTPSVDGDNTTNISVKTLVRV